MEKMFLPVHAIVPIPDPVQARSHRHNHFSIRCKTSFILRLVFPSGLPFWNVQLTDTVPYLPEHRHVISSGLQIVNLRFVWFLAVIDLRDDLLGAGYLHDDAALVTCDNTTGRSSEGGSFLGALPSVLIRDYSSWWACTQRRPSAWVRYTNSFSAKYWKWPWYSLLWRGYYCVVVVSGMLRYMCDFYSHRWR